jgi:hypothetical protein
LFKVIDKARDLADNPQTEEAAWQP